MTGSTSRSVGETSVTCLLDAFGTFTLAPPSRAFPGAGAGQWSAARDLDPDAFGADGQWRLAFHCFLVRTPGDRIVLVDTGVGPQGSPAASWAPTPGRLPDALRETGIAATDVDLVVQTHLHADHVGWAVDPTGTPMFPNARYVVQEAELAALRAAESPLLPAVVRPLRDHGQLRQLDGEADLIGGHGRPGVHVRAVPTPGHTPGHQSVIVQDGTDRVVLTGDVLVHAVQLVDPDIRYGFETDPEQARATRRALFAEAREHAAVLATAHLTRPFVTVPRPAPATRRAGSPVGRTPCAEDHPEHGGVG